MNMWRYIFDGHAIQSTIENVNPKLEDTAKLACKSGYDLITLNGQVFYIDVKGNTHQLRAKLSDFLHEAE